MDELWGGGDGDDLAGGGAVARVLRPAHNHQVQHVRRVDQLPANKVEIFRKNRSSGEVIESQDPFSI